MIERQKGVYEKVPDSGVWWIRYADLHGKIRREKAGTKSAAKKLYGLRKAEILQGRKLPANLRAKPVRFADIAKDGLEYSRTHKRSHGDDVERMKVLCELFGEVPADALTPKEIERKLFAEAKERNWKPATINRYKALASLAFRLAFENGRVQTNPVRLVRRLKENNGVVRYLHKDELKRLRSVLEPVLPYQWSAVQLAVATGLRAGEQFSLRWDSIDNLEFQTPQIHLALTKNGSVRHVPLNASAIEALRVAAAYSDGHEDVFLCRPYRAWFDTALAEADIKGVHWHCLRHTFGSTLAMAGVDIRTIAELMGHKSLQMTMRYAHLAPEHNAGAVAKLDGFFETTDSKIDTEPKPSLDGKVLAFHQIAVNE